MNTSATPAGRGVKGSALPASLLNERDARVDDEAFYTGLGAALLRSLDRELALMRSERAAYDYVNGITR